RKQIARQILHERPGPFSVPAIPAVHFCCHCPTKCRCSSRSAAFRSCWFAAPASCLRAAPAHAYHGQFPVLFCRLRHAARTQRVLPSAIFLPWICLTSRFPIPGGILFPAHVLVGRTLALTLKTFRQAVLAVWSLNNGWDAANVCAAWSRLVR